MCPKMSALVHKWPNESSHIWGRSSQMGHKIQEQDHFIYSDKFIYTHQSCTSLMIMKAVLTVEDISGSRMQRFCGLQVLSLLNSGPGIYCVLIKFLILLLN